MISEWAAHTLQSNFIQPDFYTQFNFTIKIDYALCSIGFLEWWLVFSRESRNFRDSATIHRTRFYIFKHSMNSMSYMLPPPPPPPQHASSNFLIHPSTLDFILSHFTLIYLQKNTYKRIRLDINSLCGQKHLFLETQYWHMHHILNWFWFSQTCKSLMIYWEDQRTLQ